MIKTQWFTQNLCNRMELLKDILLSSFIVSHTFINYRNIHHNYYNYDWIILHTIWSCYYRQEFLDSRQLNIVHLICIGKQIERDSCAIRHLYHKQCQWDNDNIYRYNINDMLQIKINNCIESMRRGNRHCFIWWFLMLLSLSPLVLFEFNRNVSISGFGLFYKKPLVFWLILVVSMASF